MSSIDPAVAFATSYFYGFVKVVCEALAAGREIKIGSDLWRDAASRQARLELVVPDDLQQSAKDSAAWLHERMGLREAFIQCSDRTRTAAALSDTLTLVDVASVLDSLRHVHPPSLTEAERAQAEKEGLVRFKQEIARLIAEDKVCRRYATVHGWDWWQSASMRPTG